jgi:hypothetical protein
MFDPDTLPEIRDAIRNCTSDQIQLLDEIRESVKQILPNVRTIRPRSTTSISLVASDGGNNKLVFDPFYVQIIRVVDSYGKSLCFDAVSPTTDTDKLSKRQFDDSGNPQTSLGVMMKDLKVKTLHELSHMIPSGEQVRTNPNSISRSWVLVYREICEWAVLYERICHTEFATDTLIVRDGLLRTKKFRGDLFRQWRILVESSIERIREKDKRKVFLVGLAKHSKVIDRYGLALALEGVFPNGEAKYVRVPRDLESQAYIWQEWARGEETEKLGMELPKFVAGDMYFVRFGPRAGDPVWAVDILSSQVERDQEIFSYLLADAKDGFPIPFYPRCLQKADEYAQVVDLDLDILQDQVFDSLRHNLAPKERDSLDGFRLAPDLTGRRYD